MPWKPQVMSNPAVHGSSFPLRTCSPGLERHLVVAQHLCLGAQGSSQVRPESWDLNHRSTVHSRRLRTPHVWPRDEAQNGISGKGGCRTDTWSYPSRPSPPSKIHDLAVPQIVSVTKSTDPCYGGKQCRGMHFHSGSHQPTC